MLPDRSWMQNAKCANDPYIQEAQRGPDHRDIFFEVGNSDEVQAYCRDCFVRNQCEYYGNATDSKGAWGGFLQRGRRNRENLLRKQFLELTGRTMEQLQDGNEGPIAS